MEIVSAYQLTGTYWGAAEICDTTPKTVKRIVDAELARAGGQHWAFDEWGRFLPEHTTAVSILDRLLHHASVVSTDGESHRMRQAKSRTGTVPGKR